MRMDPDGELTAEAIVNEYEERALADVIHQYGEERRARAIARAIVARRPLHTTGELVGAIEQAVGRGRERHNHPATLTFQALRIAVNRELDFLVDTLFAAYSLLGGAGARLVVIAFHSLETASSRSIFGASRATASARRGPPGASAGTKRRCAR